MDKPFIYIASLRRTGSTVLAEALTQLPHCFIFREPHLTENRFVIKSGDDERFAAYGVDLNRLAKKWAFKAWFGGDTVKAFRDDLLPRLTGRVEQVGVKDIHPEGWEKYRDAFPGMKVVLNARDPRDIFLSLHHRLAAGKGKWEGPFTPERVAESLNADFAQQRAIDAELDTMKVRYEDLCTDAGLIERVKRYTGCSVPDVRAVGQFNASNPARQNEYELHGDAITDQRVRRFEREPDAELAAAARMMVALMPEYSEFWGYADA